jgi:hypothetical protein
MILTKASELATLRIFWENSQKNVGFQCLQWRSVLASVESEAGRPRKWWSMTLEQGDHRSEGSWLLCSLGDDRWAQSGQRASKSVGNYPFQ